MEVVAQRDAATECPRSQRQSDRLSSHFTTPATERQDDIDDTRSQEQDYDSMKVEPGFSPPRLSSYRHNSSKTPPAERPARKTKRTPDHLQFLVPKIRRITPKGFKNVYAKAQKEDLDSKLKKTSTYVPGDGFDIFEALPVGMPLGGKRKGAPRVPGLGRLELTLGSQVPEKGSTDSKETKEVAKKKSTRSRKRKADEDAFDFSDMLLPPRANDASRPGKRCRNKELDAFDAAIGHLAPSVKKTKTTKRSETPNLDDGDGGAFMDDGPALSLAHPTPSDLGQMKQTTAVRVNQELAPPDSSFRLRPTLERPAPSRRAPEAPTHNSGEDSPETREDEDVPNALFTNSFGPELVSLREQSKKDESVDAGTNSSPVILEFTQSFKVRKETADGLYTLRENAGIPGPDIPNPNLTTDDDSSPELISPHKLLQEDTAFEGHESLLDQGLRNHNMTADTPADTPAEDNALPSLSENGDVSHPSSASTDQVLIFISPLDETYAVATPVDIVNTCSQLGPEVERSIEGSEAGQEASEEVEGHAEVSHQRLLPPEVDQTNEAQTSYPSTHRPSASQLLFLSGTTASGSQVVPHAGLGFDDARFDDRSLQASEAGQEGEEI